MSEGEGKFTPSEAKLSQAENEELKGLTKEWQESLGLKGKENEVKFKRFHELRAKQQGFSNNDALELSELFVKADSGEKLTPEESKKLNQLEENYSQVSWPGFKLR